MEELNRALVLDTLEGRKNFLKYLSDDAVFNISGVVTWNGKAEIINKFANTVSGLFAETGKNNVTNILASGDQVVVEYYASDRKTINGDDYNNTYCCVYTIVDGLITRINEYNDSKLLLQVLGDALTESN